MKKKQSKNLKVIYFIQNHETGKFYIGSTVNFKHRFNEHKRKLNINTHANIKLQNAWNKYSQSSFTFSIIEYVDKIEDLLIREQYFMDLLKPEYNIALSATAPMQGRKHSKETIKKIKKYLNSIPKGKNHFNYGRTWTNKQKKEFSKSRKEMELKHSDKTKRKMSKTSKKLNRYKDLIPAIERSKKPILDSNNKKFKSMTDAAKYHKVSVQTVCDILKGRHSKTRKGISFKYV